ncbi:MAG: FG-GAP repeat protein, partial [Caldilineaceae bacterium]|nr:FG-GAP repeat protein [Caldilineaceae bacterium]
MLLAFGLVAAQITGSAVVVRALPAAQSTPPPSSRILFTGQVTNLQAADPQNFAYFGQAASLSGDTLVIGAPLAGSSTPETGAAYVFQRNQGGADNWGQVTKLTAADAEEADYFGHAVSISGDTIVVGAYEEDSQGPGAGAVYIFQRNQGGANNWGQVTKITAADAEDADYFGYAVHLDGDTLIVGAPLKDGTPTINSSGVDIGAAYVFQRNQGGPDNWGQVTRLTAADAQDTDTFGLAVGIHGDTIAVGAHQEDSGGEDAGAVYIFQRNQGGVDNWGQVTKILAADAQPLDYFGYAVSIHGDTLAVGVYSEGNAAPGSAAAYIFERNQGGANNWGQV